MEEALKRVQQNLWDARDKKNLCRCCGIAGYRWQWCQKEISFSSTQQAKGKKKPEEDSSKAPTHTVRISDYPISCEKRILANLRLKAGDSERARTRVVSSAATEGPRRVWEVNSEGEDED